MADDTEVVRTYEGCQYYAKKTHLLAQALAPDDPRYMAFRHLGTGPYRAAPKSTQGLHSLVGRS
jgi:hypothetical protein